MASLSGEEAFDFLALDKGNFFGGAFLVTCSGVGFCFIWETGIILESGVIRNEILVDIIFDRSSWEIE